MLMKMYRNEQDKTHDADKPYVSKPAPAGSLPYCAPEIIRGALPDRPSDCWALGVMLYAGLVGHLPFQDAYEPRLVYKIINAQYELPYSDAEDSDNDEDDQESGGFGGWGMLMGSRKRDVEDEHGFGSRKNKAIKKRAPAGCLELIRGLLCVSLEKRWTAQDAFKCCWLSDQIV
jgi:serine/threonine protein kinase